LEVCVGLLLLGIAFPAVVGSFFTTIKANEIAVERSERNLAVNEAEAFARYRLDYTATTTSTTTTVPGGSTTTSTPGATTTTTTVPFNPQTSYLPCGTADLALKSSNALNAGAPQNIDPPLTFSVTNISSKELQSSPSALSISGSTLWVTDASANTVRRYEVGALPASGERLVARIPVGRRPLGVAASAGSVWVSNFLDGTVTRVNPATNAVSTTRTVGTGPKGVVLGGGFAWVANSGSDTVSKVSTSNNAVAAPIPVGDEPTGIAFDGTYVWVTNYAGNSVSRITVSNNAVSTFPVGAGPTGVVTGAGSVWVVSSKDNNIWRLNPATGAYVTAIPLGIGPQGVSFDGTSIWVTGFKNDDVTRITPSTNSPAAPVRVGIDPVAVASGTGTVGTFVASSVGGEISRLKPDGTLDSSATYASLNASVGPCTVASDETGVQLWKVRATQSLNGTEAYSKDFEFVKVRP
jgi:YVTN family beta-propeller protein